MFRTDSSPCVYLRLGVFYLKSWRPQCPQCSGSDCKSNTHMKMTESGLVDSPCGGSLASWANVNINLLQPIFHLLFFCMLLLYVKYKYYPYINVTEDIIYVLVTLLITILAYRWASWIRSCGCRIVLVGGAITKLIRLTAMRCYFIALKKPFIIRHRHFYMSQ